MSLPKQSEQPSRWKPFVKKIEMNIMVYDPNRIFLQVVRHLEMTPSISLKQLSINLGIERHTIEKAVKSSTGSTFREFRGKILLKLAYGLLTDQSNRTIKEVAFSLGYRSQGSFSRFIRIATGCSAKNLKTRKLEEIASKSTWNGNC